MIRILDKKALLIHTNGLILKTTTITLFNIKDKNQPLHSIFDECKMIQRIQLVNWELHYKFTKYVAFCTNVYIQHHQ